MKDYLILLVSASAVGIVADLICGTYGVRAKGLERVLQTAVAFALLCALFTPLVRSLRSDAFPDALSVQETPAVPASSAPLSFLETECEAALADKIIEKTGIKPTSIRIDMELSEEGSVRITAATVLLPVKGKEQEEEVRRLSEELLKTDVMVNDDETTENAS